MGLVRTTPPELLIIAAFSRHQPALDWAQEVLQKEYGPLAFTSLPYDFTHTRYYSRTMGDQLRKLFLVFEDLQPPDSLARLKQQCNALEEELGHTHRYPDARPLNLDPGLLNLGKFMLATTKDQAHRLYLGEGIFAESTLRFEGGEFYPWPWTYADYREPGVLAFFCDAREYYRQRRAAASAEPE